LNTGRIGNPPHQAVECIDFPHEMAFAKTADRGVTGHDADRVSSMCHQRGARAQACGRGRGLAAGMAATYNDHII